MTAPSKTFDLATRRAKDAITVPILDPVDQTETGIVVTIAGRYSPAARAAQFALADAARARKDGDDEGAAAWDARLLDLMAACTLSWEALEENGVAVPCTPEAAKRLYSEYPWLRDQVQAKYLETAAFFDATRTA